MVVSNISYFHPYLGKISILTNIFQSGSNHQLDQVRCNFCLQSAWGACLVDGFGIAILWFSDGPAFRRRNKSLEKLECGNKLCKGSSIHTPRKVVELSSPLSPIFIHFSFGYLDFFEAILLFRCEKKILVGLTRRSQWLETPVFKRQAFTKTASFRRSPGSSPNKSFG